MTVQRFRKKPVVVEAMRYIPGTLRCSGSGGRRTGVTGLAETPGRGVAQPGRAAPTGAVAGSNPCPRYNPNGVEPGVSASHGAGVTTIHGSWSKEGVRYWRTDKRGGYEPITQDEFFAELCRAAGLTEREEANPGAVSDYGTRCSPRAIADKGEPAQPAPSRSVSLDQKEQP